MPENTLSRITQASQNWLKTVWLSGTAMLLLLFALSFTWKVQLNQDSVQQEARLWGSWMEQISQSQINPPSTHFTSSLDGTILSSHPLWLEGMDLNISQLWQPLTLQDDQAFSLIPHTDLDSKQPGVYVVSRTPNGREYRFLPFSLFTATAEGSRVLALLNAQSIAIYATSSEFGNQNLSLWPGLGFKMMIRGGRLMLVSTQTLPYSSGLQLAVATDFTITFAVLALIFILFQGLIGMARSRLVPLLNEQKAFSAQLDQAVNQLHDAVSPVTPTKLSHLQAQEDDFEPDFKELRSAHDAIRQLVHHALDTCHLLKDTEQRLIELNQLSPVGIVMLDPEGLISTANPRLCEILHQPRNRLEGSRWLSYIAQQDQRRMQYMIDQQMNSDEPIRLDSPSSQETMVYCTFVPRKSAQGTSLGTIGAITDVTALSRATRKLEELEARWQFALESSGSGVWDWKIATGEAFYSVQWCSQLGYTCDEVPGQIGELINRIHPRDVAQCKALMDRYLEGHVSHYECEHQIRCKDGSYKWMLNRAKVVAWDQNGKPARVIGTQSDITGRKHQEDRIRHLAYHDSLTDLPNRTFLQEELHFLLAQLKRNQTHSALLFLDIDHFKMINDSMGHLTGDEMLRQVAQRLKENIREGDVLVRLGGDEFVIVLGNPAEDLSMIPLRAQKVANNILDTFRHPFLLNQQNVVSGTSIGIVSFPSDGSTVDEVLKHADTAMYEAKKNGRNRFHFYRAEMAAAIERRLFLENALRTAIQKDELTLVYQPKVSLHSESITGAEALLRWKHQGEPISPAEFIPVAEETGLIIPLGHWILQEACRQIKLWKQDLSLNSLERLAINVSPLQFSQPEFAESTLLMLREMEVDPHWLELELTEGVFMKNLDHSRNKMETLREHGIRFAMDDFGTGYSSLAYLKRLPLDVLKIDQAFVRDCTKDPNDASIVRTVLAVAEGVESEEHVTFLREEGCQYFQGYYFSKPVPADQLAAMIRDTHATE